MTKLKVARQPKSNNVLGREQWKNLARRRRVALKSGSSIDVSSSSTHAGPSLSSTESERELKMRLLVGGPEAFKHITHPQHLRCALPTLLAEYLLLSI